MDELNVVVQQDVGKVAWNFDSLKTALAKMTSEYKNVVYSDETIISAKSDVAMLRKLRKQVEGKRLEVKRKCLEPYGIIEGQAKELTALIDDPIGVISKQIDEYNAAQRQMRKKEILSFFEKQAGSLPEVITQRLKFKIYDSRWENAAATKKSWMEAIRKGVTETAGELELINDVDEDFRDVVFDEYSKELSLHNALKKAEELRRQKERVLENERRRIEEERLRQEQIRRKEREMEEKALAEKSTAAREKEKAKVPGSMGANICGRNEHVPGSDAESRPGIPAAKHGKDDGGTDRKRNTKTFKLRFTGSESQLSKVLGYAAYVGAKCEVG